MTVLEKQVLIIIPDVHGRPFWRDPAMTYQQASFVFLGDYLDPYDSIDDKTVFQELVDIVAFKKANSDRVTLLLGNHDLHYISEDIIKGSRYDEKNAERNKAFFRHNWDAFQIAYETKIKERRYLFSHDGVGRMWIKKFAHLKDEDISADYLNKCMSSKDFYEALNEVSSERGGKDLYGSMIWADAQEQLTTANVMMDIVQIFGHTSLSHPINIQNKIYCLDCERAFYLNLTNGMVYDLTTGEIVEESFVWT